MALDGGAERRGTRWKKGVEVEIGGIVLLWGS
jgi:hypothetical protein